MNLKPAPQDLATWLPDALEVMERNDWRRDDGGILPPVSPSQHSHCTRWAPKDDAELRALLASKTPKFLIARSIGRTYEAVITRAKKLRKEGAL
jgi:hypothetical protein